MCQAATSESYPRRGALTKELSPSYTIQKSVRSVITLLTEKDHLYWPGSTQGRLGGAMGPWAH